MLLKMKVISMFFLLSCLSVSATTYSQTARITLKMDNSPLKQVLQAIQKASPYKFVYNTSVLPANLRVNVDADNEPVADVLTGIFRNTGLSFTLLENNLIAISSKNKPLQQQRISGMVVDEDDLPLPGVTVRLKNNNGFNTATDENGHFGLNVPAADNYVLILSHVGFETQELSITGETNMKIVLKAAPGSLKQVVVLGYTQQKKTSITGSVSTVSGDEIKQSPSGNISNTLAGRLPGLIAFQGSGQPGRDDSRLLVRGISSSTNSSPLIVIDGIPQESVDANGNQVNAVLPHIDPNDIESVSVLKDAGTAAVYGARAANGVILITTKRGKVGKPVLSYTFNGSWQKPSRRAKLVNGYEYATLLNETYRNEGTFNPAINKGYTDEQLEIIRTGADPDRYANTDWYSALMKPSAFQQRHNLTVNGGSDRANYFISGGYLNQPGLYPAAGYKQYSLRSNLDAMITNRLKVSLNINGRVEKTVDQVAGSAVESFYRQISPLIPSQFSNGYYNYISIPYGFSSLVNGSAYLMSRGAGGNLNTDLNVLETVGSLVYSVPFITGLSAKGTFSYNKYSTFIKNFTEPYTTYIRNDDGTYTSRTTGNTNASLTESYRQRQTVLAEASLNYQRSFGKHAVNAMALYTQTENTGDNFLASRSNFPSAQIDQLFAGDPATATNDGRGFRDARKSVVGRLAYTFKDRYLFEYSFRYDGSDVFPPGQRFGFFPSVSAGWILSEESFIRNVPSITFLKVRGSWGRLGNDRIGRFDYLSAYTLGTGLEGYYTFGGADMQALVPGVIPNAHFTWEKADMTNFGVEARFFGDKLGIEADYFFKRTKDILGNRSSSVPATIGGALPNENLSVVDNKGVEVALSHQNTIGELSYFIRPNITFNKNRIVYAPQPAGLLPWQSTIGHPIAQNPTNLTNLGYIAEGLYQSTEEIGKGPAPLYANVAPGDIRYADLNNDGKITPDDRTIITKGDYPQIIYGIALGGSFKNFELNVLFQGAGNIEKYMSGLGSWAFAGAGTSVPMQQHLDRWTPENNDASYPRLFRDNLNNQAISSYWLRNASYLRLKNLELGYNLPARMLSGLRISSARIYVSGSNLLTFSKMKDVDPEAAVTSFGATSYLIQKLYNIGFNVKF